MSITLVRPVAGETTDAFGLRSAVYDDFGNRIVGPQLHTGQDFKAPRGTAVYAAHAGRVNRVWWDTMIDGSPAGGNMLQIGSAACSTRYAHLDSYAVNLGQHVNAGDLVGYLGSTGAATGPHLHFELLLPGGQFVDPMPYLKGTIEMPLTQQDRNDIETILRIVIDDRIEKKIMGARIQRGGAGQTGTTTLRDVIAWFDASRTSIAQSLTTAIKNLVKK